MKYCENADHVQYVLGSFLWACDWYVDWAGSFYCGVFVHPPKLCGEPARPPAIHCEGLPLPVLLLIPVCGHRTSGHWNQPYDKTYRQKMCKSLKRIVYLTLQFKYRVAP